MLIGGQEFPDQCPEGCPGRRYENPDQGSLCFRRPIFNCRGPNALLHPDQYQSDWAEEWKRWFDQG